MSAKSSNIVLSQKCQKRTIIQNIMKQIISTVIAIFILGASAFSQDITKQARDKKAIKSMCGCYKVGFNFAETFSYSSDSTYVPSKVKHASATEWVQLVEDADNKVVMQHLLLVGSSEEPMIIKHWRQDWLYQNTNLYEFNGDNQWNYVQLAENDVKGQWTQKVYQVDDSPRYEGSGSWVHVDGKSYWENATTAPLPRREYTQRSDYNVTYRRNRHEITADGWLHEQDNDKIIRKKGKDDILLAQEKGYNTYLKVEDSKCQAAIDWWKDNSEFWENVRKAWSGIFGKKENLALHGQIEGEKLYEILFAMDPVKDRKQARKTIDSFVK